MGFSKLLQPKLHKTVTGFKNDDFIKKVKKSQFGWMLILCQLPTSNSNFHIWNQAPSPIYWRHIKLGIKSRVNMKFTLAAIHSREYAISNIKKLLIKYMVMRKYRLNLFIFRKKKQCQIDLLYSVTWKKIQCAMR